jgi:hypothetical protein
MLLIDLEKCCDEIQEFFLMDDKHYFDDLTEYMNYRANQVTMIIEKNCRGI